MEGKYDLEGYLQFTYLLEKKNLKYVFISVRELPFEDCCKR